MQLQRKVCVGATRTPALGGLRHGQRRSVHARGLPFPKINTNNTTASAESSLWRVNGYSGRLRTCAGLDHGLGAGKGGRRKEATRALGAAGVDSSNNLEKAQKSSGPGQKNQLSDPGSNGTNANVSRGNRPRIAVDVDEGTTNSFGFLPQISPSP